LDDIQVRLLDCLRKEKGVDFLICEPVRADFNDLHVFEEYLRGYRIFRTFFAAHM
jgi:hypothetical protein